MNVRGIFTIYIAVIFLSSSISTADINDSLVTYYSFSGSAENESGNGNNKAVYGATLTADGRANLTSSTAKLRYIPDSLYNGRKTYSNGSSYDISVDIQNKEYCVFVGGQKGCSELYIIEKNSSGIKFYTYPYFNSSCKHSFNGRSQESNEEISEKPIPNEDKLEAPLVATFDGKFLNIPLIKLYTPKNTGFFKLTLEAIDEGGTRFKLKDIYPVSKKEKDVFSELYALSEVQRYTINVYSVMYKGANYLARLKYIKNLDWELAGLMSNNSDLDKRTWDLLIDKVEIGDIVFFNHSSTCDNSDCVSNSAFGELEYGYFSHAALISDIDKINKKIELFHSPGNNHLKSEQVRREWFSMNKLKYEYSRGVIDIKRVSGINHLIAKQVVEDAYLKYNSYTYRRIC